MQVTTGRGSGEIVEKKSRFLADVFPVHRPEEAEERLQEVRKRYWDARHHCYAMAIGAGRELTRCSDDGEPSGTAGKPILEVLLGADLTDTLVVVTRYFGGTLLGTGGLVRAYTQASQAGLAAAPRAEQILGRKITIVIDYADFNGLQHYFRQNDIPVDQIAYAEDVRVELHAAAGDLAALCEAVVQRTDGRAALEQGPEELFLREVPSGGAPS